MPTQDAGDQEMVNGTKRRMPRTLPVTYRPRNLRIVAYGLAALIVATMVFLAVVMPPNWGIQDRVFLILLGALIGGGWASWPGPA